MAIFLVVLLLLTNLVKLTHSHETKQVISKETSKGAKVSSLSNCSICDYHLAKDSHHFTSFFTVGEKEKAVPSCPFYNTPFVTSVGSGSSGRGPPSVS